MNGPLKSNASFRFISYKHINLKNVAKNKNGIERRNKTHPFFSFLEKTDIKYYHIL